MKTKLLFWSIAIVSLFMLSCGDKDDDKDGAKDNEDNQYVNNWIYKNMSDYYLWNDQLPLKKNMDLTKNPVDFFEDMLKKYEKYDRGYGHNFSYIESTHLNLPKLSAMDDNSSDALFDIGFHYIPMWEDASQTTVVFIIVYVKNDLPNDTNKKLKRGDVISKVDGVRITGKNYTSILKNYKSEYKLAVIAPSSKEVTINTALNYRENPVYLDSIYTEGAHKIGYLVYNFFNFGSKAQHEFDVDMVKRLEQFEKEGVTDLILDLRYNTGGYNVCAQVLASALVSNRQTEETRDNLFEIKKYNNTLQTVLNKLPDDDKDKKSMMYLYLIDNVLSDDGVSLYPIPKLGDKLKNLCILTTEHTASASELTINCLKAYRNDVKLIGETTFGKNVGMGAFFEEEDPKNNYVMWPVIFTSYNKKEESNYADGFNVDKDVNDFQLLKEGLKPIGDKDETMLSETIKSIVTGDWSTARNVKVAEISNKLPGASFEQKYTAYKMIDHNINIDQLKLLIAE